MKKFDFRLQKVLDVKEMILRKTQKDLAYAENEKLKEEELLKENELKIQLYLEKIASDNSASVSEMKIQYDYYQQMLEDLKQQKESIAMMVLKIKEIRERLLDQQKDRKALSLLKDKYIEEYNAQMLKEEQIFMDEIAVLGTGTMVS